MTAANPEERAPQAAHSVTGAGVLLEELERKLRNRPSDVILVLRSWVGQPSPAGARRPANVGYGAGLKVLAARVESLGLDEQMRSIALRYVFLLHLKHRSWERTPVTLPASIAQLHVRESSRILSKINDSDVSVDPSDDRWRKDYAIVTGDLLPVGAEFAALDCGVPRRVVFQGSAGQRFRFLRTIAFETGGFSPFFELHAHTEALEDFHPKGWLETYVRLAELLRLNPHYKGVTASSWLRDPALRTISPRLAYLRDYPEAQGAHLFRIGTDIHGSSGALVRSPTRKRLFEEGRYVPGIYLMIWPRTSLLDWLQRETGVDSPDH